MSKDLSLEGPGATYRQKAALETIMDKIFEENIRFLVKYHATGTVQHLVFSIFFISIGKILLLDEDWALG